MRIRVAAINAFAAVVAAVVWGTVGLSGPSWLLAEDTHEGQVQAGQ